MKQNNRYEIFTTYAFNQFIPLIFIQLCAICGWLVFNVVKDAILLGFNSADPFIRPAFNFWAGFPTMFFFTVLYLFLANKVSREKLFYWTMAVILGPLIIMCFWLYPVRTEILPAAANIQKLRETYPHLQGLFIFYGRWVDVLMYALLSLWGPVFVFMYVWQFANDITNLIKARFFYPTLAFLGGVPYLLGTILIKKLGGDALTEENAVTQIKIFSFVGCCFAAIMTYVYWRYHRVHQKNSHQMPEQKPLKTPLIASLNYAFSDPAARSIMFLMAGIAFIAEILMTLLFEQMKLVSIHKNTLSTINEIIASWIGPMGKVTVLYLIFALLQLRRNKWASLSILTGLTLVGVVLTIYIMTYTGYMIRDIRYFNIPLGVISVVVALSIIESIRQYWFTPLKEMFFISATSEHKIKTKAVTDILGVSAGISAAHVILFLTTNLSKTNFFQALPYSIGFCMIVVVVWFKALMDLRSVMQKAETLPSQKSE